MKQLAPACPIPSDDVPPCPTAQPSFAETIKTELRFWPVGEAHVLQLVPFHRMIVPPCPTAQPSSAILLLSVSSMNILLRTFPVGEATVLQLIPFHRMIVPAFPLLPMCRCRNSKDRIKVTVYGRGWLYREPVCPIPSDNSRISTYPSAHCPAICIGEHRD